MKKIETPQIRFAVARLLWAMTDEKVFAAIALALWEFCRRYGDGPMPSAAVWVGCFVDELVDCMDGEKRFGELLKASGLKWVQA